MTLKIEKMRFCFDFLDFRRSGESHPNGVNGLKGVLWCEWCEWCAMVCYGVLWREEATMRSALDLDNPDHVTDPRVRHPSVISGIGFLHVGVCFLLFKVEREIIIGNIVGKL
jgi:hypothetical protein